MSGFVPLQALMASAGSGKTFSLVVRYLGLLFLGENPEEIVALTFTNKAAKEMQERMIEVLTHLDERDELKEISALCGVSREEVLHRRTAVMKRLLGAETKVMTIDSFFSGILRKFALHAGIMPNFSTFEAQHELKVMARFLRLCEHEGMEGTLVEMAQISAKRLRDIFELMETLYAKAPQMKRLHFNAEPPAPYEARAMQLHAQLVALFEGKALSDAGKKALRADDFEALLGCSWLEKPSMEYWVFKKVFEPQMDGVLVEIQRTLQGYMRAKEQSFFAHLFALLELYKSAKMSVAKEENELSFDDITAFVHHLLVDRVVDREFLYFRLDSRISHMLLDEFQDTSVLQFEILDPLVREIASGAGVRGARSFFIVGDVKQSIYRFRGGAKELFGAVIEGYGLEVDSLRTNWRSSRSVVTFVNQTFRDRIAGYEDQRTKPDAHEGYVEIVEDEALLERMLETVRRLLSAGARQEEIAVLTATNKDGSAVHEILEAQGIEVVTETTSKLINQRRVRALIAYLHYAAFNEEIYAQNFFALTEMEPCALPRYAEIFDRPAVALRAFIAHFGLFEGDLNILRFLERLEQYGDLEAFLFEYERLDAKAVRKESEGVRVLTVHKSKGLEYPYVIVLDRLGKKRADTTPILYRYDGIHLQGVYLRQSKRAAFDPEYADTLEKEAVLAKDDAHNALYVAFTRAREQLYILKKPKGSDFDALSLSPMSMGTMEIVPGPPKERTEVETVPYAPLAFGRQTEVVQTEATTEAKDPFAVTYGTALHYALEMLPAFESAGIDTAMTAVRNRFGDVLAPEVLASIQSRMERLLVHAPFMALISGECRREQPLMYEGALRYIDLLVQRGDGWTVIDYKSARTHEAEHCRQVGAYIKAVEVITGAKVEGYLCYLLEETIEIVKV